MCNFQGPFVKFPDFQILRKKHIITWPMLDPFGQDGSDLKVLKPHRCMFDESVTFNLHQFTHFFSVNDDLPQRAMQRGQNVSTGQKTGI